MNKIVVSVAAAACLAAGCGSPDDIRSGKAFLAAFPDKATLVIETPDSVGEQALDPTSMSQALVGERAHLHDLSFYVAWQVNSQTWHILSTIWFVTRFSPTAAWLEDGVLGEGESAFAYNARATWGPIRDDEGKNLEFILHVWRGIDPADGRISFIYYVAGRPLGGDQDAWIAFVVGGAKPAVTSSGVRLSRVGLVEVDCDALRTLDPTEDDLGTVTYAYEVASQYHAVAAVGQGVWSDKTHTTVTDATYFYGRSILGNSVMEFETEAQAVQGEPLERLHVRTGWLANGDGRSDAQAKGGDLGDGQAQLTECWGPDLKQTYFRLLADGIDISDGQESNCFTTHPIEVPEIDYQAIRDLFDLDF